MPDLDLRDGRVEAVAFGVFAALHLPGLAVAVLTRSLDALAPVAASAVLWSVLAVVALRAARRDRRAARPIVTVALALDVVVLTLSGLSPPRPGNVTTASVGLLALCAAAALLTRTRHLPFVVLPAAVGQAVLLHAVDGGTSTPRLLADVCTVVAAGVATTGVIAWLEHGRRRALRATTRAAGTDALTGLLNRRGLRDACTGLGGEGVTAVVADIDHFKSINDRHGHDVGDAVLVVVAQALRECSRPDDVLVRLGGEELAWIGRWPDVHAAVGSANRFRDRVAEASTAAGAPVTVSAGVAATGPGPFDLSALLSRADAALYAAKATGRDRVVLG
ncbi:diguanylate cyclase [Kineococcus sp. TBRC 1896]|uniref:Diguanylate cyclase n=1 Tax=Kineococcus mangrovi TaxID=1660183 RepID=A0ABV4I9A0_9ACTN